MKFIIAKKIGMSRIFDQEGNNLPVTLVSVVPAKVYKNLNQEKNGYNAICAKVEEKNNKKNKKPSITEFLTGDQNELKIGDQLGIEQFELNDKVKIEGRRKGKGFSGAIKRHSFSTGPKTHGSDHHRAVGSIGGGYPQRVVKGRKMPGRISPNQVTVKNLRVLNIDKENGILAISGAVPGPNKSIVKIVGE